MSGARSRIARRVSAQEPQDLYTHCYGHMLNLAVQAAIKGTKVLKDTLDTVHEITKLFKK